MTVDLDAVPMAVTLTYSQWTTVRLILEHANSTSKWRPEARQLGNAIGDQVQEAHARAVTQISQEYRESQS
jgi:hypothetical protein